MTVRVMPVMSAYGGGGFAIAVFSGQGGLVIMFADVVIGFRVIDHFLQQFLRGPPRI
jgi:hypothetical protein